MTPYFVPLPKITHLLRAYAGRHKPWGDNHFPAKFFCYSLGRWALTSGVCALTPTNCQMHVWLPEYICSEVPAVLVKIGAQVRYYPVTKLLQPEWDWLCMHDNGIRQGQVLVIVHYFGFRQDLKKARTFCDRYGLSLLEDAAHCLPFQEDMKESIGDALVFSPRKIYPIPGIGLLLLRSEYEAGDPPGQVNPARKRDALVLFSQGVLKRGIHAFNLDLLMFKRLRRNGPHGADIMELQLLEEPSSFTNYLFSYYHSHRKRISDLRRHNYSLWHTAAASLTNAEPLFPSLPVGDVPQIFPLIIWEEREAILSRLKFAGIPRGTWPDLPDEIKRLESSNAKWLQEHLITLPVHQDLKVADMLRMTKMFREILAGM
jgi:hypothetical protein